MPINKQENKSKQLREQIIERFRLKDDDEMLITGKELDKVITLFVDEALEKQKHDFLYTPFFHAVSSGVEMSNICDRRIKEALKTQRKAILEEVKSRVIENDEDASVYAGVNENRGVYRINNRNQLREEMRQKLSILEGETK